MAARLIYRRIRSAESESRPIRRGPVLHWESAGRAAVVFSCLCGEREVYVVQPPHKISFDGDDRLTIEKSCGYKARPALGRKANWCHFMMKGGRIKMLDDSKCPGASLRLH